MTVFMLCSLEKSTIILLFYEYINKRHFNFVLDENVKVKKMNKNVQIHVF